MRDFLPPARAPQRPATVQLVSMPVSISVPNSKDTECSILDPPAHPTGTISDLPPARPDARCRIQDKSR
jgi:hypothetical protein